MIGGHGGNIYKIARELECSPEDIIDMSSNINPLGPPPGLLEYLKSNISASTRLPEVDSRNIVNRYAGYLGIDADCILAGNGTTQLIYAVPQVLGIRRAVILGPTYSDYADACKQHDVSFSIVTAEESAAFLPDLSRIEKDFGGADTVFLCNPNNPTGSHIGRTELKMLCERYPKIRFIIDESYLPFVNYGRESSMVDAGLENVIVLLSISKMFAIPGLRIGFMVASASMIDHFRHYLLPWSVNSLAQTAVRYLTAPENSVQSFINKTRRFFETQREEFDGVIRHITSIRFFPSRTPFFLAKLPVWMSAGNTCACLASNKILIRNCSNFYGLSDRFIRISLKSKEANRLLAERLADLALGPFSSCSHFETKPTIRV